MGGANLREPAYDMTVSSDPSPHVSTRVSYMMPVLNEEEDVAAALASILEQDGVAEQEIIVVLGSSTDRTDQIVADLAATHPQIVTIENRANGISKSLNMAAERATSDVLIRVDAHSILPPEYTRVAVAALREHGAVNVGGRMHAEGDNPFASAVAWAYNSPAGLGGAIYHTGGKAGPAESAYLGVFDRAALLAVGGYDESLSRGEDWELNVRLREAGGAVWFEPAIDVAYRPRKNVRALAKQFHASGRWRAELVRRMRGRSPLRYFVPPALVLALVASLIAVGVGAALGWPGLVLGVCALPWIVYVGWLCVTAAGASGTAAGTRVRLLAVLPIMHIAWGLGCLVGIVVPSKGHNAYAGR